MLHVYQLAGPELIASIDCQHWLALRTTEECHVSGPTVLLGNTVQAVMKGSKEARVKREKGLPIELPSV